MLRLSLKKRINNPEVDNGYERYKAKDITAYHNYKTIAALDYACDLFTKTKQLQPQIIFILAASKRPT